MLADNMPDLASLYHPPKNFSTQFKSDIVRHLTTLGKYSIAINTLIAYNWTDFS